MFSIDQISVAMTDSYPPAARFIPLLLGGLKARSLRGRERNARFVWIESSGHTFASGNLHLLPFRTASVVGESGPHWGLHIVS